MNPDWPNNATFWRDQRVTVTGGAGFLGSFVADKLRERGAADIFVPRKREYDLVQREAILEMLHDARPDLIIHLAARVGGIPERDDCPCGGLRGRGALGYAEL